MPPSHRHPAIPASQLLRFLHPDRLDALLAPLLPEAAERQFIARCLIEEGPLHHRGANYALIGLLGRVVAGLDMSAADVDSVPVPMRLPPHLAETPERRDYPIRLPLRGLRELAGGNEQDLDAMVDCLCDGPPQHALANVIMVALLTALLPAKS
jgi:hypothetical protein